MADNAIDSLGNYDSYSGHIPEIYSAVIRYQIVHPRAVSKRPIHSKMRPKGSHRLGSLVRPLPNGIIDCLTGLKVDPDKF